MKQYMTKIFVLTVGFLLLVGNAAGMTEETKLIAALDGESGDHFGYSVAVDGDTAVIGAYYDNDPSFRSGSVYVFTRNGGTWTQQAKLNATDGASNDFFGISVAIDGDTIVIGAHHDDDKGFDSGSAYVFTRSGTTWTQQAKLNATDGASLDFFGHSVSVNGDTAVIGAYWDDDKGGQSGSAYVFTRGGTTWTQQAKLNANDGDAGDIFGVSVSVDGDTVVISAHQDDDRGTDSGSAYVFTRSGGTWTQQAKLNASDGAAEDDFGYSVAIDGDTVVIGAPNDDDKGSASGSAYVYSLSSTGNNVPVAFDDNYNMDENTVLNVIAPGVLGNDDDLEGDTLNAVLMGSTTNGILILNGNGSFNYTPDSNFNGTDSFTYKANDGHVNSSEATVTIIVNSINEPPEFIDVPALTTLGIMGLVGLLGIISVVRIKRRL